MQKQHIPKRSYQDGEEFLILGESYLLKIGDFKNIELKNGFLYFPNFMAFRIKKEIDTWLLNLAKKTITAQVEFNAKQMRVKYDSISFSDTKSKWGSCSHDNRLQFSWRLASAPLLVINYVVIHELTHIIEKNHSHHFWSKVRFFNPSYKQQIKWLKNNGDTILS